MMPEAYVTLATNDGYAVGALVLGHSLHSSGTTRDLCIMITPAVSQEIKSLLEKVFNRVVVVDVLNSGDSAHLALLKRPELGVTFTKLHCWTLTEYSKCVFLDADMLAVQNPDDLFTHPELSAVCDIGWPDCFNSGMFVFIPQQETYSRLLQFAETTGSFDGGDQGLLNSFFPSWHRLSFVYNMVASATYTYLPAYKRYGSNAKLVHFLGSLKPWHHKYNRMSGTVQTAPGYQHLAPYLDSWWAIYTRLVQPRVPDIDVESAVMVKSPIDDVQEATECIKNLVSQRTTVPPFVPLIESNSNEVTNRSGTGFVEPGNLTRTCLPCVPITSKICNGAEKSRQANPSTNLEAKESTRLILSQISQQLGSLSFGESPMEGQARWERGEPDYLGRDAFANIQAYIDSKIKGNGK